MSFRQCTFKIDPPLLTYDEFLYRFHILQLRSPCYCTFSCHLQVTVYVREARLSWISMWRSSITLTHRPHMRKPWPSMPDMVSSTWWIFRHVYAVWCCYNAVNLSLKYSRKAPHRSPVRARYGLFLWVQPLIDILLQFLQLFRQHLTILDCIIQ